MEQEGKIDIHNRKHEFERTLNRFKQDESVLTQCKNIVLRFIDDCEAGKTLRGRQKKKIGTARLTRIIDGMRHFSKWFNKPFSEIDQQDLELVISNLEKDVYKKSMMGKITGNFSHASKVYYKKLFKKFNRWMQETGINKLLDCGYIETYELEKEIEIISKEEMEKMVAFTPSLMRKALLSVMFDSGARAEELLNVCNRHITQQANAYSIRIEFSKTNPRTIVLPIASNLLGQWLNHTHSSKGRNDQIFPLTYDSLRMFIGRSAKKVLGRHLSPHAMRHSSATYYCNKLTQSQLCKRYGWGMSSKMPARYINRSGFLEEGIVERVNADESVKVMKENEQLREQMILLKQEQESQLQMLKTIASQLQAPVQIPYNGTMANLSASGLSMNDIFTPFEQRKTVKTANSNY